MSLGVYRNCLYFTTNGATYFVNTNTLTIGNDGAITTTGAIHSGIITATGITCNGLINVIYINNNTNDITFKVNISKKKYFTTKDTLNTDTAPVI